MRTRFPARSGAYCGRALAVPYPLRRARAYDNAAPGCTPGECEVRSDDIGGIALHIGPRVSAIAGPNDMLVSSTLRDLVIGSGLEFEERGTHKLKACPANGASSPSPST